MNKKATRRLTLNTNEYSGMQMFILAISHTTAKHNPSSVFNKELKFNLLLLCNVDLQVQLIHKKEIEEPQLIMHE